MAVRHRMGLALPVAVPLLAFASQAPAPSSAAADPFASFRPGIEITADDRARADRGETVVHILPAKDNEIAVLGVERDQLATSRVAALLGIELEAQQVGALLAIQLAAAAVLRAVAELRWRSVDWLRLRPKRVVRSAIG